jgi:hypothetical protein
MEFRPSDNKKVYDVPFFDDVTAGDGWQGQTTGKSIETLKVEIGTSIARLGGMIVNFQMGEFIGPPLRYGCRIFYIIESEGKHIPGQLDVAALPVRPASGRRGGSESYEKRVEKSMRMTLFMVREALAGMWFMQMLNPGYAPLMPWMIDKKSGKTITQLYNDNLSGKFQLPEPSIEEGEFHEIE